MVCTFMSAHTSRTAPHSALPPVVPSGALASLAFVHPHVLAGWTSELLVRYRQSQQLYPEFAPSSHPSSL
eukprot:contig_13217_g3149